MHSNKDISNNYWLYYAVTGSSESSVQSYEKLKHLSAHFNFNNSALSCDTITQNHLQKSLVIFSYPHNISTLHCLIQRFFPL